MVEGASYITLITRTGQTGLWCDFVHSCLLLVQCRQARCAIVESASYTQTYYSYNTDKRDVRLLSASYPCAYYSYNADKPDVRWLRALRTLTLITYNTDKANVRLLLLVHWRLLIVQYRQAWGAMVESASYTHAIYSYNTDKANVRLLRVLSTLTLITRTVQTSLMCDCWECFVHSRLLLVQYIKA